MNDFNKPVHTVILGAGASAAAFPNGDKYGRKLPIMNDLIQTVGLDVAFPKAFHPTDNFETVYAKLRADASNTNMLEVAEEIIQGYFSAMLLPDSPTLYDHLAFSLSKKDVIATFNWDPLLFQACARVNDITNDVPKIFFLHGNVGIKIDETRSLKVPVLSETNGLRESILIFPHADKDYSNDPFISSEWSATRKYLAKSLIVTIFGYSAPSTDLSAVTLMKEAWLRTDHNLKQVEIIDIKDEEDLRHVWSEFIFEGHVDIRKSFYDSWLAFFPGNSCQSFAEEKFGAVFLEHRNQFEGITDWDSLQEMCNKYSR